jgi:hypothetical protein
MTQWLNDSMTQFLAHVIIAGLLALPVAGQSTQSQTPPQDASGAPASAVAADVKEVTLPVTVHDKHGKIVHDLTKDDFTLQEDGRPQIIRSFSQETNLPLTIGLLVDTSRSQDKRARRRTQRQPQFSRSDARKAHRQSLSHSLRSAGGAVAGCNFIP